MMALVAVVGSAYAALLMLGACPVLLTLVRDQLEQPRKGGGRRWSW
jgi:hypothetical protein